MRRTCGHDGGVGIGAGHVCRCVRAPDHPLDSDRPHGCSCGALWGSGPVPDAIGTQVDEELVGVPGASAPRVELANIRRLCEHHGITPADRLGVIRSTVAMVEELAIRRPPV